MTTALFTTWTRITGDTFENGYDADPNNDLEMADTQREKFLEDCKSHLITEVDAILEPYQAELLGHGDIVGNVDTARKFADALESGDLREELTMIDFDQIISKYL